MADTEHARGTADAGHHHAHGTTAHACCGGNHGGDKVLAPAIDPVCGMSVNRETAKHRFAYKGQDHFFCSGRRRERFEAEPEKNLKPKEARQPEPDAPAGPRYPAP